MDLIHPPIISGPTVTLRLLDKSDAVALAVAAGESREHYRYTAVPEGLEETQRYIETALAEKEAGYRIPFTIIWNGRAVGSTSYLDVQRWKWPTGSPLQRTDRPDAVEIGATWLALSAQRTRCNTEAKHLLLSHAFETWDVYRVAFRTDERNARSRRAIERLGAVFEGVCRADRPGQDGTIRSSASYSILKAEWPDVRHTLEQALAR